MLRIGFAKGRGAAESIDLMRSAGVLVPAEFRACRMTMHHVPQHDVDCFILRGEDIPPLLASGHLDAAVASSIVLDEHAVDGARRVGAVLDIGLCRLSLIVPWDPALPQHTGPGRLCTRYPRTAARLLAACGAGGWEIRRLAGCVEAGLFLGLSDAIVDIVETGWTLKALALREHRVLCSVQHQVRLRSQGADPLPRMRALMPEVLWESEPESIRSAAPASRAPSLGRGSSEL
jgi:ATP phosphoribosyltransferase